MSDPKSSSLSLTFSEASSVTISLICRWHQVLFPSCQFRQEISLYFPASGRDRELDRSQETGLVPELQIALQWLAWKQILRNFYSGIHLFKCFIALEFLIASNCSALAPWWEELGIPSSANKEKPNQAPLPGQERGYISSPLPEKRELHSYLPSSLLLHLSHTVVQALSVFLWTNTTHQNSRYKPHRNVNYSLHLPGLHWLSEESCKSWGDGAGKWRGARKESKTW